MAFRKLAFVCSVILPTTLAGCVESGGKAPPAGGKTEATHGTLGAKGVTADQRRWLDSTHTPPAGG